jgi:hypothetical protein
MHWIDPDFLPDIKGNVERFVVNPNGEIDGLVLAYDDAKIVLVHVPPHLDHAIAAAIRPGDDVRVRGIRPRGADMIAAVALTTADGHTIVDDGPGPDRKDKKKDAPHHRAKPGTMTVSGVVRLSLYGPKGELRGALLDDGIVVRIEAKEAPHLAEQLRPHATISARGDGLETRHCRVVAAKEIGPDPNHLRPARGDNKPGDKKRDDKKSDAAIHAAPGG